MQTKQLLVFLLLGTLAVSSIAYAHKITVFAYVEGGIVHTETYFSDGTRAKNAQVFVYELKDNKLLLQGKTNRRGEFNFKPPLVSDLKIVVVAEMGHRAETIVKAVDLKQGGVSQAASSSKNAVQTGRSSIFVTMPHKGSVVQTSPPANIDETRLRQIISEEVEKGLKPVLEQMVKIDESLSRPSFIEIAGGIGYILGFFGLWAIWRKRD